jgi:hypothetical protein
MNILDSGIFTNQFYMTSSTQGCNVELRIELLKGLDDQNFSIHSKIKPFFDSSCKLSCKT